jgi:membrane-bound metal-dependent hydrolase YbcI (DUF457 family)
MIIPDHFLMGSILGISHPASDGYVLVASIAGSLLPDIDLLHGCSGTIGYLDKHRTYTHSIWLSPVLSFLLAISIYAISFALHILGVKMVDSIVILWLWCFIGVMGHLLVDVLNSFGTTIWWWFNNNDSPAARVAKDLVFECDVIFTSILVFGLFMMIVLHFFYNIERYPIAIITAMTLIFYIGLRMRSRVDFRKRVWGQYDHLAGKVSKSSFVPAGWWRWKAILETQNVNYVVLQNKQELEEEEKAKVSIPDRMSCREVDVFIKYARHLDVQVESTSLKMYNLIYSPQIYPFNGSFIDQNKPVIKIGKLPKLWELRKWKQLLTEYPY